MNPPTRLWQVLVASFIGTTIEWYDFFLYGTAAALVFNRLFFPEIDPLAGTMAAFGTYTVGFLARPLGGVLVGHFGDVVGRRAMLMVTLVMMGLATCAIGLLPTYQQIGPWAPALLVLLRFIQGLGVGGEWGGAVLMAVECGHKGQRGLYASFPQAGVPMGLLLATAVFSYSSRLPEATFLAWGWRVPFLLGIVLVAVGLFVRLSLHESPLFEEARKAQQAPRFPIVEVLRRFWRSVLIGAGSRLSENVVFYIYTVFVLTYAQEVLKLPKADILDPVLLAAGLELFTIPFFGALSDRIGRRPVFMGGVIFSALMSFPFFWLVHSERPGAIALALVLVLTLGHAAMYGPQAVFFSELFGTSVRYSGASLGYQLASILAGGLAPLIATALLAAYHSYVPVALYMMAMGVLSVVSLALAGETYRKDLSAQH